MNSYNEQNNILPATFDKQAVMGGIQSPKNNMGSHGNMLATQIASNMGGAAQQTHNTQHIGMVQQGGGMTQGGMTQGGMAQGGMTQGGMTQNNMMQGGMAQGGMVQGGMTSNNMIQGGMAQGGFVQGGMVQGGMVQGQTQYRQMNNQLTVPQTQGTFRQVSNGMIQQGAQFVRTSVQPGVLRASVQPGTTLVNTSVQPGGLVQYNASQNMIQGPTQSYLVGQPQIVTAVAPTTTQVVQTQSPEKVITTTVGAQQEVIEDTYLVKIPKFHDNYFETIVHVGQEVQENTELIQQLQVQAHQNEFTIEQLEQELRMIQDTLQKDLQYDNSILRQEVEIINQRQHQEEIQQIQVPVYRNKIVEREKIVNTERVVQKEVPVYHEQYVQIPQVEIVEVPETIHVDKIVTEYVDKIVEVENKVYKDVVQVETIDRIVDKPVYVNNFETIWVEKVIEEPYEEVVKNYVTEFVDKHVENIQEYDEVVERTNEIIQENRRIEYVPQVERVDRIVKIPRTYETIREVKVPHEVIREVLIDVPKDVYVPKVRYEYIDEIITEYKDKEIINYIETPVEKIVEVPVHIWVEKVVPQQREVFQKQDRFFTTQKRVERSVPVERIIENIVEVPEVITQTVDEYYDVEKVVINDVYEQVPRPYEVEKVIWQDKFVDVEEIEYIERPVYKTVENIIPKVETVTKDVYVEDLVYQDHIVDEIIKRPVHVEVPYETIVKKQIYQEVEKIEYVPQTVYKDVDVEEFWVDDMKLNEWKEKVRLLEIEKAKVTIVELKPKFITVEVDAPDEEVIYQTEKNSTKVQSQVQSNRMTISKSPLKPRVESDLQHLSSSSFRQSTFAQERQSTFAQGGVQYNKILDDQSSSPYTKQNLNRMVTSGQGQIINTGETVQNQMVTSFKSGGLQTGGATIINQPSTLTYNQGVAVNRSQGGLVSSTNQLVGQTTGVFGQSSITHQTGTLLQQSGHSGGLLQQSGHSRGQQLISSSNNQNQLQSGHNQYQLQSSSQNQISQGLNQFTNVVQNQVQKL